MKFYGVWSKLQNSSLGLSLPLPAQLAGCLRPDGIFRLSHIPDLPGPWFSFVENEDGKSWLQNHHAVNQHSQHSNGVFLWSRENATSMDASCKNSPLSLWNASFQHLDPRRLWTHGAFRFEGAKWSTTTVQSAERRDAWRHCGNLRGWSKIYCSRCVENTTQVCWP